MATIASSLAFACAAPFVALATLAARNMRRQEALLLMVAVWLANQVVGYGFLDYPRTVDSFGWGAALGIAAVVSAMAAIEMNGRPLRTGPVLGTLVAFVAAFVAYEGVLMAATLVLPSGAEAFSPRIMLYVLEVNVLALVGLYVLSLIAPTLGLPRSRWQGVLRLQ
ncbi:MAG: hypothetical protein JSR91_18525 [Proteobacteria bacterium]|nr:hypothetical protein [Pseudomonadota bacterium]